MYFSISSILVFLWSRLRRGTEVSRVSGKSSSAQNTHLGSCLMSSTGEKQNARFGNICDEINDLTIYAIIGPVNGVILPWYGGWGGKLHVPLNNEKTQICTLVQKYYIAVYYSPVVQQVLKLQVALLGEEGNSFGTRVLATPCCGSSLINTKHTFLLFTKHLWLYLYYPICVPSFYWVWA